MKKDNRTYSDRKAYMQKYQKDYYNKNKDNPKYKELLILRRNKPSYKLKIQEWNKNNSNKIKGYLLKHAETDKRKRYIKEYNLKNNIKIRTKQNEWNLKNPDKVKQKFLKYNHSIKGKINNIKKTNKRRSDILQRLNVVGFLAHTSVIIQLLV